MLTGCLIQLILGIVVFVLLAAFRLLEFVLILVITSASAIFIGPDEAIERIADSWIEVSTANGVPIGYDPAAREAVKATAAGLLVVGWALILGIAYLVITNLA
jgi:hypothetical protein